MDATAKFNQAINQFDAYNSKDPNTSIFNGQRVPDALLYAQRMTEQLNMYEPEASEQLQLAARCQHIGRWEISRSEYPMDRKGYLQWRSQLKIHHAKIASQMLEQIGYDSLTITQVSDLLVKKQLKQNSETQILEDVVCFVFLQYYFDDFSKGQEEEKVIKILQKTMMKMSAKGIEVALDLPLSDQAKVLIAKATS